MESLGRILVLALCCGFFVSTTFAKSRSKRAVSCPSGWSTYEAGSSCYRLYTNKVDFATARQNCVNEGGDLASVTSQGEHDFLLSSVWPNIVDSYAYIGGSDAAVEGTWTWSDGSTWSFESWGIWNRQQLPVHGAVHNCLTMTTVTDVTGDWYDFQCTDAAEYICEKAATPVTTSCSYNDGRNWHMVNNRCYFLVRGMKNWQRSLTNCENMGANLASIHGQTLTDFFINTWVIRYGRGMWIGLHDRNTEGSFEWSDGTSTGFFNWATINGVQQPESNTAKNCVGLESPARGQAGKWNDFKCSMRAWSICQKDPVGL